MSYQRAANLDKNLVFQEYFNDEQSVRRNGGVPTGTVDFNQGKASITNSSTSYRINWNLEKSTGDRSVRIRFKLNTLSSGYRYFLTIRDITDTSNTILCRIDDSTDTINASASSLTLYLNGSSYVNQSQVAEVDVWYDIIITIPDIAFSKLAVNVDGNNGTNNSDMSYDFIEVYNKILTAEEVSNLYNDARYRMPQLDTADHQRILHVSAKDGVARNLLSGDVGEEKINTSDFSGFSADDDWILNADNSISCIDGDLTAPITKNGLIIAEAIEYNVAIFISGYSQGNLRVYVGDIDYIEFDSISDGWNFGNFVQSNDTGDSSMILSGRSNFIGTIEYLVISTIIPEVTNTDIEVVRDSPGYVPRFNGDTSKIDCGDYNDLDSDLTILSVIKVKSLGELDLGMILDNSELRIFVYDTINNRFRVQNDASTDAFSGNNAFKLNEFVFLAITRTVGGIINIYINGELNGVADQNAGTPTAGTTNILIGDVAAGNRNWDGIISDIQIIEGVLTTNEISQWYTSTKYKYNK